MGAELYCAMLPFANLQVFKKAYEANRIVYSILKNDPKAPRYLREQFGKAALSTMLNIAEGSAKFSRRDRRNFFVIARGSVFECLALVNFLHDVNEIALDVKSDLCFRFEEISRVLYTMIRNLEK